MDITHSSAAFQVNSETDEKINALLAQMTLMEKIGQMTQLGTFDDTDKELIQEGKVGSILGVIGANYVNELQRIAVEDSRLGIPLLIANDVIHGYRTTFPIPLAEASSWNMDLIEETAAIASREASAEGIHWILAPMVDIARDPRWGRIAEGAGEDTYLASQIARARVTGIQRNDWNDRPHIVACPKHFAGYGLAEAGRDYNTVDVSEVRLREIYFPPFQAALEAGAGSIMASFNELNGVPCSGNKWLLKDVLQDEWGFPGIVVSDWESIDELVQHGYAETRKEAAKIALESGMHMDMQSLAYYEHLHDLVNQGTISEKLIDDAVRTILRVKFQLGLFEHPYTDNKLASTLLLHPDHVETAREMAQQSIVLLKNDGKLLPLTDSIRKLAVIGPLADNREANLGCWSGQGRNEDVVSILEGIRSLKEPHTDILFAKGCDVTERTESELAEAINLAGQCEAVVMVLGETANMSGENNSRVSLELPKSQLELLEAVQETGVPIVLVLINGRPLSLEWADVHIPAIVEAWQLGIQAGNAVADILFGQYNPSGKLPVTFPRHVGQVPIYYNAKKTGRPHMKRYVDSAQTPLYPFGFGLSYTEFEYSNLSLSSRAVHADECLTLSVLISNAGLQEGEEVVQLYICDEAASVTRPVKELKGFQKIRLKAGESRTITFELTEKQLGFVNRDCKFVVEPGTFKVWVGTNSSDGLEGQFNLVSKR
jgi:beta-glucosidase